MLLPIDSQIEFLKNKVLEYNEVLYDIGSGFNFKRRQFKAILERCIKGELMSIGSAKTFIHDGVVYDRDVNGARNIFIKNTLLCNDE